MSEQSSEQSSESSTSEERARVVNLAWAALAQGNHAEALSVLGPYAEETKSEPAVAQVWAAMLGALDDERHLSYELMRLAGRWAEEPEVVKQLAKAALSWASKHLSLAPPLSDDSLPPLKGDQPLERAVWLAARVVSYCLEHAPPSAPQERAELYHLRARLLCWGGAEAEEQALSDLEVSLSLHEREARAWYTLARLHLSRARWEKALLANEQAQALGLDALQLTWLEVVARTALGGEAAERTPELWHTLNHDDLTLDVSGRAAKVDFEPQLIALHSHMASPGGGYDLTLEWALERVWVQPLSPCHGRLIHPPLTPLPAGYDDLIVWDPQPVGFEEVEGDERPVLRAIATLERGRAQSRPLLRPLLSPERLDTLNKALPKGVFFYQAPHGPAEQGVLCWPRGEALSDHLACFEEAFEEQYQEQNQEQHQEQKT
jgi:hypothetical protein